MAERKRPRRTRERILETSLALFNRDGEPHVTTAHVAIEMNISPGNLYYHFPNKDAIIEELYGRLEAKLLPLLTLPFDRSPGVEDLWFMLHVMFETMGEFRFLYRDIMELTSRNRALGKRFAELTRKGEDTVLQLLRSLERDGALRASEREMSAVAQNIVIVATYWMSFHRTRNPVREGSEPDAGLVRGAHQVLALIAPFALGETRELIDSLGQKYIE